MKLTLRIWRQKNPRERGAFVTFPLADVSEHMSFLEMLDVLNESLIDKGQEPVAFDHDCREGICGACSLMINGYPHGPLPATTTCQLHMRHFKDGDVITVEPWRARAFPVLKDCVTDRSALDRIMQAGGFVSVRTGGTPDANALPIRKKEADLSMDAAACIGCGACVAACKNASAMLFVAAKVGQFAHLPQGQAERKERVRRMTGQMDKEGFGNCTNTYDCEGACPKQINRRFIAEMNRDFICAELTE
ncbi:MAG: succinate dehydrogenase/fumarate reductase iron-sulfur subunit [Deltaproteobacteria bacterium]|nr:succinate dehydrogenase/fumarate reductase iron-sulfur subunit [Deltaproteobacteria bacterium]